MRSADTVPRRRAGRPTAPGSRLHPLLFAMLLFLALPAAARAQVRFDGEPPLGWKGEDCIPRAERALVAQDIARFHAQQANLEVRIQSDGDPAPYPFLPQAGNLWDDLFLGNFTDLDRTTGIRDWDCTNWTYDGHRGLDIGLHSFAEQDAGVPVFAALDGTVVSAHDGEFDRQTAWTGARANSVVLFHGGTHYTWYWHLRKGSVAVSTGQQVKAGTQLGLTGSSGQSTGPHLHFESQNAGTWFEPFAGMCNSVPSSWVRQVPIRRDTYLLDMNVTDLDPAANWRPPNDMPRAGTFVAGNRDVAFWILMANQTAGSTWRVRFLHPDGAVARDSGTAAFSDPAAYRRVGWWWRSRIDLNTLGTWHIELSINDRVLVLAPLEVVASAGQILNRRPNAVGASMDPSRPLAGEVLFCRVATSPVLDDPDYDIVRYRYQWTVNGALVRDVTTAGRADALASGLAQTGDLVACTVTPTDGRAEGPPVTAGAVVGFTISGRVTRDGTGVAGVGVSAGGRSATTAADGAYTIRGLAVGSHTVTASRAGTVFSPASRLVTLGPDAAGVDFLAAPAGAGVSALAVSPAAVTGAGAATGTVTLDGPAPPGGAEVALSIDNPAAARSPASVSVPAGATSVSFSIATQPVAATTPVLLTASHSGATRTATLTVLPAALSGIILQPAAVAGGGGVTVTVLLTGPAARSVAVALSSDRPAAATVPASITVDPGKDAASVRIQTSAVSVATEVVLSASYAGVTRSVTLTVAPVALASMVLSRSSIAGGMSLTGEVTLSTAAPTGGVAVRLSSDNLGAATVPATVTVPEGETRAVFTIATSPVASQEVAVILASAGGVSRLALLYVNPP